MRGVKGLPGAEYACVRTELFGGRAENHPLLSQGGSLVSIPEATGTDDVMPKTNRNNANPSPTSIPPVLTGVAGEYFVAAELSRRGYIASISLRNTRGIDILATNQAATRSITIQSKTNQSGARSWILNEKSQDFFAPEHVNSILEAAAA